MTVWGPSYKIYFIVNNGHYETGDWSVFAVDSVGWTVCVEYTGLVQCWINVTLHGELCRTRSWHGGRVNREPVGQQCL